MNLEFILSVFLIASVLLNGVMIWYVKKLMSKLEEDTVELSENIDVFQANLEEILNTDLVAGEPIVMQLLNDVRALGEQTENIKRRLLPQSEEDNINND
jgi:hypothetical protein